MALRALIVTYYWPPAGGPGVQRWLNFVKYFSEFGIEPVVYIPENPHYPLIDKSFLADVPKEVEIIEGPIKEPYRLAGFLSKKNTKKISSGILPSKKPSLIEKIMLYIRGNFFIPDARIAWVKPSVRLLQEYLQANSIDIIITTGPPHSLHLIGMQLKAITSLPWVADFRDPWTTIHYHKSLRLSKVSEEKHKKLEREVLQTADHIVVTSPSTLSEFQQKTNKPITVITNGYDVKKEIQSVVDESFSIAHIGSLLSERNPQILWDVLSELSIEVAGFFDDLTITLAGAVSDDVVQSIVAAGLQENLDYVGYVSHDRALQMQHDAQVLLLVEIDRPETQAIIPGKLFEYLRAKRPIVALGPKGSDIIKIITETKSGAYFNYSEKDALKKYLRTQYNAFTGGSLEIASEGIEKYTRKALTEVMATLLKQVGK